jgi:hypothetical protein
MTIHAFLYSVGATGPGERDCGVRDHGCEKIVDHVHHCWLRAPHFGGHVCICYWVWPQSTELKIKEEEED